MLSYAKLWVLIENRGMKRTDLKQVISGNTLAKLGKNETISSDIIEKLCKFLNCQPGDIMEYISEENLKTAVNILDNGMKDVVKALKSKGITEEQFKSLYDEAMTKVISSMFNGGDTMNNIFDEVVQNNIDTKKE